MSSRDWKAKFSRKKANVEPPPARTTSSATAYDYSKENATDIASLWQDAMHEYCTAAGLEFSSMKKFHSFAEIEADQTVQENFIQFREGGGKFAKLRSTINANADLILSGAKYIADAASAAFPPSAAILTALTYVMKVSKDVSKDYDKLMGFFGELKSFLERIGMMESRLSDSPGAYKSHILRVFVAIMQMLGLATRAVAEGRMWRSLKTMLRGGGDDELAGATGALETAMKRLESATGIATLAKVVDIDRDTREIKGNVVTIVGLTQNISTDMARMGGTAQETAQGVQSLHDKVDANYLKLSAKFEQMLEAQRHSLAPPEASASTAKVGAANKPTSFNVVQRFFNAHDDSNARNQEIEYDFVDGTTQWLFERKEFVTWREDPSASPYLWIIGEGGVGKSFLAYSALRELQKQTASHSRTTVAHYCFRQQNFEGRSDANNVFAVMHSMLSAIVNQIAMYDKAFCDQVATTITTIREDIVYFDVVTRFEKFLAFKFQETSSEEASNRLFLILDGLDEICNSSKEIIMCLQGIMTSKWNIRVFLTSRANFKGIDELEGAEKIQITKDDVKNDVQIIAASKITRATRLRKLRPAAKRIVENTLVEQSDSLLYTDQALRRLNKYHQESSVLTALSELPKGLDGLYQRLEEEVAARRTPDELQTVRLVYTWIAFAKQSISVEQITDIVKLRGLSKLFNIEEEISSRSGLVLTVTRDLDPSMADSEDADDIDQSTLDAIPVSELVATVDTAPIVRLHNRAMKDHLRGAPPTGSSLCETKSSAAFSMFELCAQIITSSVEGSVCARLRRYAVTNWALHFNDIDPSTMSDEAFHRGLHILHDVLTNKNDVATFVEKNYVLTPNSSPYFYIDNSPYAYILAQAKRGRGLRMTQFKSSVEEWLKRSAGRGSLENQPELSAWVQELVAQPDRTLNTLAKAHVQNWLTTCENKLVSYTFAISALNYTTITPQFFYHNSFTEVEAIEATFKASENAVSDAGACRALAITLREYRHYKEAAEWAKISQKSADNDFDRFAALVEQAAAELQAAKLLSGDYEDDDEDAKNHEYQKPYATVVSAMEIRPISQDNDGKELVRRGLTILGSCQHELAMYDECVRTINEARDVKTESLMTGDILHLIISSLYYMEEDTYRNIIDTLMSWDFFELMAWLTDEHNWEESWDPQMVLQHAGTETDEQAFVIEVYAQIIKYLEPRHSAGRIRNHLADFYRNVILDTNKAKELWLETANSETHISTTTGAEDDQPIWQAYLSVSNVIYHQFRTSSSPREKIELLEEMRILQQSRDGGPLQAVDTYGVAPAIVYANMIRKVGSEQDFEDVLSETFDSCYTALTDTQDWNDVNSLCLLAKVLALVGGLERDAQIAFSAQFSVLEAKTLDFSKGDYSDDGEWGEVAKSSAMYCQCGNEWISDWSTGPLYLCILCTDIKICQECYDRLVVWNSGGKLDYYARYCGKNHKYIKGPVDGWQGIRQGIMSIGEEKIEFKKWLEEIKEKKWTLAWERFWKREDGIGNIL